MWLVWILTFVYIFGQTPILNTHYETQNNYFSADFRK